MTNSPAGMRAKAMVRPSPKRTSLNSGDTSGMAGAGSPSGATGGAGEGGTNFVVVRALNAANAALYSPSGSASLSANFTASSRRRCACSKVLHSGGFHVPCCGAFRSIQQ